MENQSYGAVRIESAKFGKRGVLLTSIGFALSFGIMLLIGGYGPEVFTYNSKMSHLRINRTSQTSKWRGVLQSMSPENQLLWLACKLKRPEGIDQSVEFSFDQEIATGVWASNQAYNTSLPHTEVNNPPVHEVLYEDTTTKHIHFAKDSLYSDKITLFNFHSISYLTYVVFADFVSMGPLIDTAGHADEGVVDHSMDAEFEVIFVNPWYTQFEMKWKYFFVIVTLIVMFFPKLNRGGTCSKSRVFTSFSLVFEGYFTKLCGTNTNVWSFQQKWIAVLLVLLLLFNDPLIYYEIYNTNAGGEALGGVYIGLMATFICVLMLFWLCVLDETRSQGSLQASRGARGKSGMVRKHLFKGLFLGAFWIFIVTTYSWIRMHQKDDPTYEAADEGDRYVGATVTLAIFLVIYMVWFLAYTFLSLSQLKQLPPPFMMVFVLTFFTFIATLVGLFTAAMYPVPSAALDFIGMYSLYNLYVWTLAFVYAPLQSGAGVYSQDFDSMDGDSVSDGSMMGAGEDAIDDMQL